MLIYLSLLVWGVSSESDSSCFTSDGRAVRCMPDFMNIAFNAQVFASNTCGNPPTEYCVQQEIGLPPNENNCYKCDAGNSENKHPPEYLTDRNEDDNSTWWQSETLWDMDINNMTLHLPFNKSFDIEYIKIEFQSPRPESMIIEKSTDYGRSWDVYQYFSSSCYKTFDKRTDETIYSWDETKAICTRKYSEISPLQGGIVNFSPLKDRPSSKDLYNSPTLLKWSRATDIRIRLIRLNTFGDQFFSDRKNVVLKTYFYAISDLSVGGRCTCHGHGGSCTREACKCEHNTAGRNCERCADMYNDLPWKMSTTDEPFLCKECQCNDLANRCVFDKAVFEASGGVSGGVCVGCRSNTAGQHCEECAHGFYPNPDLPVGHPDRCRPCECNEFGSIGDGDCSKRIDVARGLSFGDCRCKSHVQGISCDTCQDGYYGLQEGCLRCECDPVGTVGNIKLCLKSDGQCKCKENVAGRECNRCEAGFYNYLVGCMKCNCNKAGSVGKECHQETGQCVCKPGMQGLDCSETEPGTFKPDVDTITFGPDKPDGGKVEEDDDDDEEGTGPTATDDGMVDDLTFQGLQNKGDFIEIRFTPPKDGVFDIYVKYTLLSGDAKDVMFDVTAVTTPHAIRQCTAKSKMGWLDDVKMTSFGVHELSDSCLVKGLDYVLKVMLSERVDGNGILTVHTLVLMPEPEAAVIDNMSDELGEVEWQGDANDTQGAWDYCQEKIAMFSPLELKDKHPACSDISDIIIADLSNGSVSCDCDRVGANNPDTCDKSGGQCDCKPHITGTKCNKCKAGYHSLSEEGCTKCKCNEIGSVNSVCDRETGQCSCKQGVTGVLCDQCKEGQFGFSSGGGCRECYCSEGSTSVQCDQYGQCPCAPGVGGLRCDRCLDGYYKYSKKGCKVCNCNSVGGSKVCDKDSGRCRCKDNVVGSTCLECKSNAFSLQKSNPEGCQQCFCYTQTAQCTALTTFTPSEISSDFSKGDEEWAPRSKAPFSWSALLQYVELKGTEQAYSYCLAAPAKFLGNQLNSFLTDLSFNIYTQGERSSVSEVFIRSYPYTLSMIPRVTDGGKFSVLLHHSKAWTLNKDDKSVPLSSHLFKSVLGDIRAVELCGNVYPGESLMLDRFSIGSAVLKASRSDPTAYNVEQCQCPKGYKGSSCDECSVGYKREDPSLGKLSPCVECQCNGYSKKCDADTGVCDSCSYHTGGAECSQCLDGYYGEPGFGNPSSCTKCACPSTTRSFSNTCELIDSSVVCTNCTRGHTGPKCDECSDGFFGEPKYNNPNQYCTECTCNGNIDKSIDGNCDTSTGQCLKCVNNTSGRYCEQCAYGYHGDAVEAKNCTKCSCNAQGSNYQYLCDSVSGQCECKSNVEGLECDRCIENHYGISSSNGCAKCVCDPLGSASLQCSERGVCECKLGYYGDKCNECSADFYYHNLLGCTACNCDLDGSKSSQCDANGQCYCDGAVQGKQCDHCPVNMFNITTGCTNCPDCYSLVEREVQQLKSKLTELETLMQGIDTPTIEASPDFRDTINEVRRKVADTLSKANETSQLAATLKESGLKIEELMRGLKEELKAVEKIKRVVNSTIDGARYKLKDATDTIQDISNMLEGSVYMLLREGNNALKKAQKNMAALSEENKQMQAMASQARKIAQSQEKEAGEVTEAAKEAAQLSASALNTARRAKETLKNTQNQLEKLSTDIGEVQEEYELAKNAANESISRAQATLQTATTLRDSACAQDNLKDLTQLGKEIKVLAKAAKSALEGAKSLKDQAYQVQNSSALSLEAGAQALTKGYSANSELGQLETQARSVYNASLAAVKECSTLISDAKTLLKFLQNYENEVAIAKKKAQEAIASLDDIETALTAAELKVSKAKDKIGEGDKDMSLILGNVVNARAVLQTSLTAAKDVASQVAALLKDSDGARKDAVQLKKDVAAARLELSRLRGLAQNGTEELKKSLEEAEDSRAKAEKLGSTLAVGETRLKNLKAKLSKVDTIDAEKLNELIDRLQESENEVNASGIDDQIDEMRTVADDQEDQIAMYRSRIEAMREEIDTLSVIEKQIPDTTSCYNPVS